MNHGPEANSVSHHGLESDFVANWARPTWFDGEARTKQRNRFFTYRWQVCNFEAN
jgi:hypothetical protein